MSFATLAAAELNAIFKGGRALQHSPSREEIFGVIVDNGNRLRDAIAAEP